MLFIKYKVEHQKSMVRIPYFLYLIDVCENYSKDKIEGVRLLENCKMTTPISLNPIIRHKDLTPHETGYGNSTAVFDMVC